MERAVRNLPVIVRAEFEQMSEINQQQFISEFQRKRKSIAVGYFASLLSLHYAYIGRIGMTMLMWLVGICTLGIGIVIWWIIDLFRMPRIIGDKNSDIAISVLRDQRIISGRMG